MRLIKIIVISLYTIILGFIVFGNTSVFADEVHTKEAFVFTTTSGMDDYWVNVQDTFDDYVTRFNNREANSWFISRFQNLRNQVNYFDYIAIPTTNVRAAMGLGYSSSDGDLRGYVICVYSTVTASAIISNNTDFKYYTLNDYYGGYYDNNTNFDNSLSFPAVKIPVNRILGIYNYGNGYEEREDGGSYHYNNIYCPLNIFAYNHHIFYDYIDRNNTSGATQITSAINNQTNTLSNAIANQTQATKEQTNALLDTNNTGNETMSVNDTTTDTSADLGGLFNSINSAFTDTTSETQKGFDLTLPNGDSHTFTLKANVLTSFLDANPVLKAFYQAFFYVVFGGYVIFDFKKIINKLKEGNIDNVVGTSSPVDSVVSMSLK